MFKALVIALVAGWLALFVLVPNAMVLGVSFLSRAASGLVDFKFSLESYAHFLDPVFVSVFTSSVKLSLVTALVCLGVGYPFAYILARHKGPRKGLLLMLVIIPFWTSSLIRTYSLIIILKANGLINSLLLWSGIISEPLSLLYTDAAVTLGLVYTLLPFTVLPIYAQIEKLDERLLEAAGDLGAGQVRTFVSVTLPLSTPGVMAAFMLTFLPALGMFYVPDLLGGARTMLVGNLIRNQFLTSRDWPFGAAASMVLTLLMVALLLVYYRISRKSEAEARA